MDALILAAGRGSRMGALTESLPKPLLRVANLSLIEHQIARLHQAGIVNFTVNTAWHRDAIESELGDGAADGIRIRYSHEPDGALETAGGIANALDLIGSDPFLAVNADVWIDSTYAELGVLSALQRQAGFDAHIVLADNPSYHRNGDFYLADDGKVTDSVNAVGDGAPLPQRLTFTGIGAYRKSLFQNLPRQRYPLAPVLRGAMRDGRVSGQRTRGRWISVDTPERLECARAWQTELDRAY